MLADELERRLYLSAPILSFTRLAFDGEPTKLKEGCTLNDALKRAMTGEAIYVTADSNPCPGGATGFGFHDGLPDIPGGFGNFISSGAGEGFRPGEKIKCDPGVAEAMIANQPQRVMEGFNAVRIKPYEPDDNPDTVAFIVTPDELSVLIHLYGFRDPSYDNVIVPMVSGCASMFRIPFGEMISGSGRAVVGNIDVASRRHFDASTFIFTISNERFEHMLADADESILAAPYWKPMEKRMAQK